MRRSVGLFFLCCVVLPMGAATSAIGQGATLRVDDQTPAPGQQISVTGNGFSAQAGQSPVSLRFDSRTGIERASATPNSQGFIGPINMTIPQNLSPGWHLIIGTQTIEATNRTTAFTPGRVRINVGGAGAGGRAAPPPGGGRGVLPDSPFGLVALGGALMLLAGGAALTARRLRTHNNRPQLGS